MKKFIWAIVAIVMLAILMSFASGTRKWLVGINKKAEGVVLATRAAEAANNSAEKARNAAERMEKAVGEVKNTELPKAVKALESRVDLARRFTELVGVSANLAARRAKDLQESMPLAVWQAACGIKVDAADGPCTIACREGKKIPANCFPGGVARARPAKPKKVTPSRPAGMPSLPPGVPPPPGLAPGVSSIAPPVPAETPSRVNPLRPAVVETSPTPPATPASDPLADLTSALGGVEGSLDRTEKAADEVGKRLKTEEEASPP